MSIPELTDDVHVSQGYLNMVYSGFQGTYVSTNILEQLHYDGPSLCSLTEAKSFLDWLSPFIKQVWEGKSPLKREPLAHSADAAQILELFALHRRELETVSKLLIDALNDLFKAPHDPADIKFIVASLNRQAYAFEHTIKNLVFFSEAYGLEEQADRWRNQLIGAPRLIQVANTYYYHLLNGGHADGTFRLELWNETATLPGIFKSQIHDMCSVEAFRTGKSSLLILGLSQNEVGEWRSTGLKEDLAGHWQCMGFRANEALSWVTTGFFDASYAGSWKVRGFDQGRAAAWHNAGFTPQQAYLYHVAGVVDPLEAKARRAQTSV